MADERQSPVEPAGTEDQRALWERLARERVAMIGTRDADGSILGRPVEPVRVEPEGRIWIFTAADGDLAHDVARDARVHVAFTNPGEEVYASLNGEARVLRDPQKARELWSTAAGVWFPQGPDDRNLGLLRIDVHRGDYWDMKDARLVRFFKLAAAAATSTRPDDVATHRRLTQYPLPPEHGARIGTERRAGGGDRDLMRLEDCINFHDFRALARRRLPAPIFDYIDGGADDEVTYRRNTASFDSWDLLPNVLRGVAGVDLSVTIMGQRLALPVYCSPTALQRLFHHDGERAVAAAASAFGTMFGVSSLGTVSLEELRRAHAAPQVYQFYFHKDRGLNRAMLQRAKEAGIDVMMLTVDSVTGGNRERDLRTGFSIPFRLTLAGMIQFAIKPAWGLNYLMHERFSMPQLDAHVDFGSDALSIGRYFTDMLDPSMTWDDVATMVRDWGGQFCLKGVMSVEDARRAAAIGCTGVVLSNHGGRQLDGSRAAFDQLAEVVDAVGDRLDVMMDGGVQRGTHVLKALSLGAKAVGIGRYYLFPLAAAGRPGVERALAIMKAELERDMKLMGCRTVSELSRANLRFR